MPDKIIHVIKADGKEEEFDIQKLEHSLENSKATPQTIKKIVEHIVQEVEEGMTTHEIYNHAYSLLHKMERHVAARYSLRRALMSFGPSGFPFEKFIAEIFKAKGYKATTDQIVKGQCVDHEVDVVAYKANELIMTEVKFHNQLGLKSDLKIVLYVKARFDDLMKSTFVHEGVERSLKEGILITNTKFTISAIKYAECQKLKVIGWNYPLDNNLHDMIEETQLHPVTCLTSLTEKNKKELLLKNIVLCKTLAENPSLLDEIGIGMNEQKIILDEITYVSQQD